VHLKGRARFLRVINFLNNLVYASATETERGKAFKDLQVTVTGSALCCFAKHITRRTPHECEALRNCDRVLAADERHPREIEERAKRDASFPDLQRPRNGVFTVSIALKR
tara:strand:- start:150 stop:479 length:330 start_codon:yes stop_codon:yes gene_type:complete